MGTWNRKIEDGGKYLVVEELAQNDNPPRTDTALEITTLTADREEGGAKILYHSTDVKLTGIRMKDGGEIPDGLEASANPPGTLLTVISNGAAGTHYDYYVVGEVDETEKQTEDPKIHNL